MTINFTKWDVSVTVYGKQAIVFQNIKIKLKFLFKNSTYICILSQLKNS